MANEKRLIDANWILGEIEHDLGCYEIGKLAKDESLYVELKYIVRMVCNAPTVDAVEADVMRAFAEDVAYQFGYYCQYDGRLHIIHGGLSTLEEAFEILGWDNIHPVPECECEIDGCHEHATCGAPTKDGYKRMCGRHYRERREGE